MDGLLPGLIGFACVAAGRCRDPRSAFSSPRSVFVCYFQVCALASRVDAMSSPSAVQRHYPAMNLDRILNHSPPPSTFQPVVKPPNMRYGPPPPQMNEAYANKALEQMQYELTAVGDDRPMSSSSARLLERTLAPVPTKTYPPNRNSQFITASYSNGSNPYISPLESPPLASPYSEPTGLSIGA